MSKCCNCSSLAGGFLGTLKRRSLDPCWYKQIFAQGSYSTQVPLAGYYEIAISSNGSDVTDYFNMPEGVQFIFVKLTSSDVINFSLGDTSRLQVQNYDITTSAVRKPSQTSAGIHIQYIGDLILGDSVRSSGTVFRDDSNMSWRNLWYKAPPNEIRQAMSWFVDNGVDVITESGNIRPHNGKQNWYIYELDIPVTGEYTLSVLGDDVGNVLHNGYPVIWGSELSTNNVGRNLYWKSGSLSPAGGQIILTLTKGSHQFILYNKNTNGGIYGLFVMLQDSEGNNIVDYTKIKTLTKNETCILNSKLPTIMESQDPIYRLWAKQT